MAKTCPFCNQVLPEEKENQYEFIPLEEVDFEDLKIIPDLPGVDFEEFEKCFYTEEEDTSSRLKVDNIEEKRPCPDCPLKTPKKEEKILKKTKKRRKKPKIY